MVTTNAVPGITITLNFLLQYPGPREHIGATVLAKALLINPPSFQTVKMHRVNLHDADVYGFILINIQRLRLIPRFVPDYRFDKQWVNLETLCGLSNTIALLCESREREEEGAGESNNGFNLHNVNTRHYAGSGLNELEGRVVVGIGETFVQHVVVKHIHAEHLGRHSVEGAVSICFIFLVFTQGAIRNEDRRVQLLH